MHRGQLGMNNDPKDALYAALFISHLQQKYPKAFRGHGRWQRDLPGDLGRLTKNLPGNLEGLKKLIEDTQSVRRFLEAAQANARPEKNRKR